MKKTILLLLLSLLFCHKANETSNQSANTNPDPLLLKLNWYDGDLSIKRKGAEIPLKSDLELEKDDLIHIKNGSAELLLGLENGIKLGSHTEISFSNNLVGDGKTITTITLTEGSVFLNIIEGSEEKIKLITPNTKANLSNASMIAIVQKTGNKTIPCDKNSCETKFYALNGSALLSLEENTNELKLEKNFEIKIGKETELTESLLTPINKKLIPNLASLVSFNTTDTKVDPKLLEEWISLPNSKMEIKKEIGKQTISPVKQAKLPIKKTEPKKLEIKKQTPVKKQPAKQTNRDKLKLEANKKF